MCKNTLLNTVSAAARSDVGCAVANDRIAKLPRRREQILARVVARRPVRYRAAGRTLASGISCLFPPWSLIYDPTRDPLDRPFSCVAVGQRRSHFETYLRAHFLLLIHHQLSIRGNVKFEVDERSGRWSRHNSTGRVESASMAGASKSAPGLSRSPCSPNACKWPRSRAVLPRPNKPTTGIQETK